MMFYPRPAHGRVNAPHVQPMDEEMHKQVQTCFLRRVQPMDEEMYKFKLAN